MKKLLLAIALLWSLAASAQVEQAISVPIDAYNTRHAALFLPNDYSSTSIKYPLIVFLHGVGEGNAPLSNIYNNSSSGGPAYFIEHSAWPAGGFVNPNTSVSEKFIVASPQCEGCGWSIGGKQLDVILKYLVATYKVDPNRIFITGLSAGGAGVASYLNHIDDIDGTTFTPTYKIAGAVPMSEANGAPNAGDGALITAAGTHVWGFGDPNSDPHGYNTQLLINQVNASISGYGRFTSYGGGHCCWGTYYNPNYRETIGGKSMNIYEWMLQYSQQASTAPTANAGSAQTITLPKSSASLSGSATAGSSHSITSEAWTLVSGPNSPTITGGTTFTPTFSNLIQGTYTVRLTATQNDSQTATSDVTITVNPAVAGPVANAGSNQSITLPTSSVSLSGSGSTGTITSYAWTKVSGPAATIASPSSVTTSVTGLVQGTYVFQLSVNAGVSTATVTVSVNAQPPPNGCPSHKSYAIAPHTAGDVAIQPSGGDYTTLGITGGDTLKFSGASTYRDIVIDGLTGVSNACPVTIIDSGGTVNYRSSHMLNSKWVHWTGTGGATAGRFYGFKAEWDPNRNNLGGVGVSWEGRTKCVTYDHIFIHNLNQGVFAHTENTCVDSLIYPNWIMDSLIVHDLKIVGTAHEGMYIGSTSPDNAVNSYDPRPVNCNGTVIYPRPMQTGYVHVYNCILDSTGRGGIQVSDAKWGIAEIDHNTVKHCGMSGLTNQGTAISIGSYTHAFIHDNTVVNTLTWGIASLGGSGTGIPVRIENNSIDSTGFLYTYNNLNDDSVTGPGSGFYPPGQIPGAVESLSFVSSIFLKTVPILDTDSTMFWIKNNRFGISAGGTQKIKIQNAYATVQKFGNIICSNLNFDNSVPDILSEGDPSHNPPSPTPTFSNACPITGPTNILYIRHYGHKLTIITHL